MKKPSIVVLGGAKRISMVAVELESEGRAIELAKRLAEQSGRTVTVCDADDNVLVTVPAPSKQ